MALLGFLIFGYIRATISIPENIFSKILSDSCQPEFQAKLITSIVNCSAVNAIPNTQASLDVTKAYVAGFVAQAALSSASLYKKSTDKSDISAAIAKISDAVNSTRDAAKYLECAEAESFEYYSAQDNVFSTIAFALHSVKKFFEIIAEINLDASSSSNVIISVADELKDAWSKIFSENDTFWQEKNLLRAKLFLAIIDCSTAKNFLNRDKVPLATKFYISSLAVQSVLGVAKAASCIDLEQELSSIFNNICEITGDCVSNSRKEGSPLAQKVVATALNTAVEAINLIIADRALATSPKRCLEEGMLVFKGCGDKVKIENDGFVSEGLLSKQGKDEGATTSRSIREKFFGRGRKRGDDGELQDVQSATIDLFKGNMDKLQAEVVAAGGKIEESLLTRDDIEFYKNLQRERESYSQEQKTIFDSKLKEIRDFSNQLQILISGITTSTDLEQQMGNAARGIKQLQNMLVELPEVKFIGAGFFGKASLAALIADLDKIEAEISCFTDMLNERSQSFKDSLARINNPKLEEQYQQLFLFIKQLKNQYHNQYRIQWGKFASIRVEIRTFLYKTLDHATLLSSEEKLESANILSRYNQENLKYCRDKEALEENFAVFSKAFKKMQSDIDKAIADQPDGQAKATTQQPAKALSTEKKQSPKKK